MMRNKKVILSGIIVLMLIITAFTVYAAPGIGSIGKAEVIDDDVYAADQAVRNEGTIKGDFIAAGQNVVNDGIVEGDFISGSGEISLGGKVLGDARVAAGNVAVKGAVDKNLNVFAGNIDIKKDSEIGRNILAAGGTIKIDGKVNGITRLHGGKITLNGEFLRDVEVSIDEEEGNSGVGLVVGKDAIVHGKLTYKGVKEAQISDGAKVGDFEWKKLQTDKNKKEKQKPVDYLKEFIKLLLSTLVYFLIGILVYKFLPGYFQSQGRYIAQKPLNTIGVGLLAIIAILASVIVFAVLMMLSIMLISPSIGLIFGTVVLLIYILLFYFSTFPVSVWLGGMLLKGDRYSDMKKFGAGLAVITSGFFILKLLSEIPVTGFIFSLVSFIAAFIFVILGIGALLYVVRDIIAAARNNAMMIE